MLLLLNEQINLLLQNSSVIIHSQLYWRAVNSSNYNTVIFLIESLPTHLLSAFIRLWRQFKFPENIYSKSCLKIRQIGTFKAHLQPIISIRSLFINPQDVAHFAQTLYKKIGMTVITPYREVQQFISAKEKR
jgi:hypothetical protein